MHKSASGFTLLELLVVMVIVGIGAAVIVVSVGRGVAGDAGRRLAVELARMARAARVQALTEGVPTLLCMDPAKRMVYVSGGTQQTTIPGNLRIEAEGVLPNAHREACVLFYPDGSSTGARLKVSRENVVVARLRIDAVTGAVGRYRVDEPDEDRQ